MRRAAPRAALVVIVAQLAGAATVAWALLLTAQVLQTLLGGGGGFDRVKAALPAMLVLGAVLLVRSATEAATAIASAHLGPKARRAAEEQLFDTTLHIDLTSFDDPDFYDQLQRARDRGVLHIEGAIRAAIDTATAAFAVAGAAAALVLLQPALAPLLLLATAPNAYAALVAARRQYAAMSTTIALTRHAGTMAELATQRASAPEIRANQAQAYVLAEYRRSAEDLQDHLVRIGVDTARIHALGRLGAGAGLVATFIALGLMLQAGWLDLAVAGTAVVAIQTAGASLNRLVVSSQEVLDKALYISDFQAFLDQSKGRTPGAEGLTAPAKPGRIALEAVSFAYPSAEGRLALRDVSMTIAPGETVAFVGENGSGKTTLAKLIAGLYRPTQGRVTWGGVDVGAMSAPSLADRVAIVLQEPIRWPRSARDNVRIGRHDRPDPDSSLLLSAAENSRAQEVIARLPRGWKTLLSRQFRGGHDLSAGQWQRLAVARGLFRDAPLVIWDEPTAPLDAKAEHAVYQSLRRLAKGRTVILITHRLAAIQDADRIFFLDRGALTEQGTHAELLRADGGYAELWRLQARLHRLEA